VISVAIFGRGRVRGYDLRRVRGYDLRRGRGYDLRLVRARPSVGVYCKY
jgi:hypothetical protein